MRTALGFVVLFLVMGPLRSYGQVAGDPAYPPPLLTDSQLEPLNSLSLEERASFYYHRSRFLNALKRVLTLGELTFGLGAVSKDKVIQVPRLAGEFRSDIFGYNVPKMYPLGLRGQNEESQGALPKMGARVRGRTTVEAIIRAVDTQLFESAPLLARSGEFGVNFIAGKSAGIILGQRGLTLGVDIGIGLGYNKADQTLYFDVFTDAEWFKRNLLKMPKSVEEKLPERLRGRVSYMPFLYFIQMFRTDAYFSDRLSSSGRAMFFGEAMYPPVGGDAIRSPGFAAVGLPVSVGLPTTPFDGLIGYSNNFARINMLTVAVSPVKSGWIRVDMPFTKILVAPVQFVKDLYEKARQKWRPKGLVCGNLLG